MTRLLLLLVFLIGALAGTVFLAGCNDDDDPGPIDPEKVDMVTVSGRVFDIDRRVPAVGVRVKVYGTDYQMDVPTGDDGAFILEVPRGTNFVTHTDDFDPNADRWFPLINSEVPGGLIINDNTSGILIHACPTESDHPQGSASHWNRQLGSCGDETRQIAPNVNSSEQSGGVLVLLVNHCEDTVDNTWPGVIDTRWSVDHPQVSPVGWVRGGPSGDPCSWNDPSCADCIFEPVTDGTNAGSRLAFAFADEDFPGGDVDVVFEELDATRGFTDGTFTVPLEPGTITLAWFWALEGEMNSHWFDAVCGCEREIPAPCD